MKLRNYQVDAINQIRQSFLNGNRKVLYVLPTGGGKTVVFAEIARLSLIRKKRVVIFVHRKELFYQTKNRLNKEDIPCKILKPDSFSQLNLQHEESQYVYISMVQTSAKVDIQQFHLAIFDEAHHMSAKTYKNILKRNEHMKVVGVTATPTYESQKMFDTVIYGPSTKELISMGYLSPFKVLIPKTLFNAAEATVKSHDFDMNEVTKILSGKKIYGDIVKVFNEIIPDKTCIVFCSSIEHCHTVNDILNKNGIPSRMVTGNMSMESRTQNLQMLAEKTIRAVVSCDAITEGVDVPSVESCILLRPTMSRVVYIQQVGRVLRVSKDKDMAIIVDLVGNVMRHGLPDEPFIPKEGRKKKSNQNTETSKNNVKICKNCFAAFDSQQHNFCPYCGYAEIGKRPRKNMTYVKDDIVEINKEFVKPELWQPSWDKKGWKYAIRHLKDDHSLIQFAKYKGYKMGWVYKIKELRKKYQQK